MTNSTYVPKPRELLPDWMVGLTDRVMNYYTKRYLNCEPVILKNPPLPQEGHQYMLCLLYTSDAADERINV